MKKLIEAIFRRRELALKNQALKACRDSLAACTEEKKTLLGIKDILTTGEHVQLTQPERKMILSALEHKPFRAAVEDPATKRHIRNIWRGLREKIKSCLDKVQEAETKNGMD